MNWFFVIFFTVWGVGNLYIIRRGLQGLEIAPEWVKILFTIIIILFASSYILIRGMLANSNPLFYDIAVYVGAVWFAVLFYLFLSLIFLDVIRILNSLIHFLPQSLFVDYSRTKFFTFIGITIIVGSIVFYGFINAQNIKVKNVDLVLPKKSGELDSIKIMFFSDSHLSTINEKTVLKEILSKMYEIKPDLILIAGDIIDDRSNILYRNNVHKQFQQLKAPLGVFACTGNHEYIVGVEDAVNFLNSNGVKVLRDTFVTVANSIQIIGREDISINRFTEKKRKDLHELVYKTRDDLPTIVLDHQPFNLENAEREGIDLQLSGHTHHGQFFPLNFITSKIYELSWGYKRKSNSQFYVTSGVGTWGPPIRTGSDSELIVLNIKFE
ncbi:MAG: metallophosphoesterase [Chlorobiaceae bacterium]|nr:metallophosphoesterase [Chlorobiaceae bacterium]